MKSWVWEEVRGEVREAETRRALDCPPLPWVGLAPGRTHLTDFTFEITP